MIIDNLKNAERYFSSHEGFKEALEFLRNAKNVEDGSYEIIPDLVKVNISTYTNKPIDECKYEAHAKMTDIQCVLDGSERIDLVNEFDTDKMEFITNEYEKSDIAFLKDNDDFVPTVLKENDFAIIFPYEAHKPCVAPDGKGVKVRKAVVKIKY